MYRFIKQPKQSCNSGFLLLEWLIGLGLVALIIPGLVIIMVRTNQLVSRITTDVLGTYDRLYWQDRLRLDCNQARHYSLAASQLALTLDPNESVTYVYDDQCIKRQLYRNGKRSTAVLACDIYDFSMQAITPTRVQITYQVTASTPSDTLLVGVVLTP